MAYTKRFAAAMKAVDSTIKIIGPAYSYFDSADYKDFVTVGDLRNITGLVSGGHTYCYIDYIDFHVYPLDTGKQAYYKQVFDTLQKPGGFRDALDSLSKWVSAANTDANRYSAANNPLKIAVTEFNIDYENPSGDGFMGLGAQSFVAGQFWAEAMRYCLRDSVAFINFWSVIEGQSGDNWATNIGYLDADNARAPQPTYHHFRELAKDFSDTYLRDTTNKTYFKAIAARDSDGIHVMVLNEDSAAGVSDSVYTIYLDWSATASGSKWLKIDADLNKTYSDTLGSLSTAHLVFDNYGNISNKTWYRRYMNNTPAGFHQFTCNDNVTYADSAALSNYKPGIYKNITIGNGSNAITIGSGNNHVFRFTESATINGEFTVPLGQEFVLMPEECQ